MKAIAPHLAVHSERAIHRTREANRESLRAARERVRVVRFDDQVNVIALNGELDDAEPLTDGRRVVRTADGLPHLAENPAVAKRW